MKSVRTSIQLIKKASSEGWMVPLATYHKLKSHYVNSCIYKYRSRINEIACILAISNKTLRTYIKVLKNNGLVYDHQGNLILKSIRKLPQKHSKCIIYLNEDHSIKEICDLLYGKIMEQEGKKQAYMESIRRFERGDVPKSKHSESPFSPSMSLRTVAKYLNVSKERAGRIIKNLNNLGVIKTERKKPVLISSDGSIIKNYTEDFPGYRFAVGSKLYLEYGDRHSFLQFPIYLKSITVRQYKRHIINGL